MGLLILFAVLSIFFSFMCSILEAALLSVTPSYIKIKNKEGKAYAKTLANFKQDIDKPLIAILTVNTISHTVGAILVGVQAEKIYGDGGNAVGIVSAVMTVAILILSEIIPKTIGATYWQALGNFTAKALKIMIFPLRYTGILWLMMLTTKLIGKSAHVSSMNREEFAAITDAAEEEGVFDESETTVIKNLLVFKSVKAKDVMTPYSVAIIENEDTSIEEFHRTHKNLKFSRIPVYKNQTNNVTGFILKDDVLEEMIDDKGAEPLSTLKRDIFMSAEDTPIPELFENFVQKRGHISMIVDEFGNTVGLVTMEDIIETLLGLEIMDESDSIEDMQMLARQNWEKRAKRLGLIQRRDNEENEDEKSDISENSTGNSQN
ncbi:CNNM domain-containing protein [Salegentibacter mishustinae]|uniref:Hemolysin n=1 Tax=Salegentibacter mishustinae TaxID=270918 RepID=A0A0Q9ZCE5_9FLAO|nr:CNNM domain-containing protein [Salegentibacter mishustinae]KRG27762.1 hemolysin [Salegentibacter mishustinae]MDX1720008.1 CNNM domain-containing protein [Salegentibacter mishustinae]PNW22682.1 hemolysin [Salegentibacter mishustinae]PZX64164.1 CBS domain containing-hemolysin-like protein [Salegentibacter mishustinae]UBZ08207.1 CNNM domain-containing protein [Salegentibacter mishustinae]